MTPEEFRDEMILRQIKVSRYITFQVKTMRAIVDDLNNTIEKRVLREKQIETKKQLQRVRVYIREHAIEIRDKTYRYLQREIKGFMKEQALWMYQNSPVKLKRIDIDKAFRDMNFEAFSDTDTIKSYITRIFNQIYQIWNSQLTIAYRTGLSMEDLVKVIRG